MKKKASQSTVDRICAVQAVKRKIWFDRLSPDDQKLCLEVRQRVIKEALSPNRIAASLIAELNLPCGRCVVAAWLGKGQTQ